MRDYLVPAILLLAALGLFVGYTNPAFQDAKTAHDAYLQYDAALTQSSQLRQFRDQLLARRNTFPAQDVQRLERLLPDNIDNIRLIIDINSIASRYHLQISNIAFAPVSTEPQGRVGSVSPLGSVDVTFAINASYADFMSFLEDLQRSARMVEVENIKFSVDSSTAPVQTSARNGAAAAPTEPVDKYTLTVRTYWLK